MGQRKHEIMSLRKYKKGVKDKKEKKGRKDKTMTLK